MKGKRISLFLTAVLLVGLAGCATTSGGKEASPKGKASGPSLQGVSADQVSTLLLPGTLSITSWDDKAVLMGVYGLLAGNPAGNAEYPVPFGQHELELYYVNNTGTAKIRSKKIKITYDFEAGKTYRLIGNYQRTGGKSGTISARIVGAGDYSIFKIQENEKDPQKKEGLIPVFTPGIPVYNASGTQIAYNSGSGVVIHNALTGEKIKTLAGGRKGKDLIMVFYSPDGTKIYAAAKDNAIKVWDIAAEQQSTVINMGKTAIANLAYSANGQSVAIVSKKSVDIFNLSSGQKTASIAIKNAPLSLAFSPDGTKLLSMNRKGGVFSTTVTPAIYDAKSGTDLTPKEIELKMATASWTPDGKALLVGTENAISSLDANTFALTPLLNNISVTGTLFSPDGNYAFYNLLDYDVSTAPICGFINLATGEKSEFGSGTEYAIWTAVWNPNSKQIVAKGTNGIYAVINANLSSQTENSANNAVLDEQGEEE
jgi:hypothetical protein